MSKASDVYKLASKLTKHKKAISYHWKCFCDNYRLGHWEDAEKARGLMKVNRTRIAELLDELHTASAGAGAEYKKSAWAGILNQPYEQMKPVASKYGDEVPDFEGASFLNKNRVNLVTY